MRTKYSVNTIDTEARQAWMDNPAVIDYRPGEQDSGRCRFTVTTDNPTTLTAAFDTDPDVLDYEEVNVAPFANLPEGPKRDQALDRWRKA